MVRTYESLVLSVPEITGDEIKNLENQLDKCVKAGGGSTISFERWGKYKLAYDINKSQYGVYFLMRFEAPLKTTLVNDMKTLFKVRLNNVVMRDMISVLDPKRPLTYQRARSLEEAPMREESGLLRDNKSMSFFAASDRGRDMDEEE
jgi:ribosomal protein S6